MQTLTTHTDLWWPYGGPIAGRYTYTCSGTETDGRLEQFRIAEHRGAAVPLHVHHDSDETFLVLSGTVTARVGDATIEAGPGDFVLGPAGVPHAWIVTSETAELFVTVAGAGLEGFFREVAPPVVDGEAPPEPRMPDPALFATRMAAYGVQLLGPPPF